MERMDINIEDKDNIKKSILTNIENATSVEKISSNIINFIDQYLDAYLKSKQEQSNMPIRMVKQYISENYSKPVTLDELAREVYLNPVYLSIIFKKETGENIKDYLKDYRMDEARKLLKNSRYNISEISLKVGYRDVKYFSRLFKKSFGVKPTEYRKLYS
jgi:two-component system response regulator YesN